MNGSILPSSANYLYKMINKRVTICCLLVATGLSVTAQRSPVPQKDAWLGEPVPGATPRIFAAGRVSDALSNRDMAMSPRGGELFYTIQAVRGQVSMILRMYYSGGVWSGPEMAPFSGRYGDLEPAYSASGDTLYFASNRPLREGDPMKDYDIWMVRKENGKWGEPARLDTVINSVKDEFYPSVARNGNLYFTREMKDGKGHEDIAVSEWKNGRYQLPYSLPETINTDRYEFNAFVDPDEQYLLFSSFGRSDELGGGDLYLSFKDRQGRWMQAIHLDSTINSNSIDFCPYVSPDGDYLFFTSGRMRVEPPFAKPLTFKDLQDLLGRPGNGLNDIYWVSWKTVRDKYFPRQ
jgi:Tol biopolymer transport system component